MSVNRFTYVSCDKCGKQICIEDCSKKVAEIIARERGWAIGKRVTCNDCKRINRGK